MMATRLMRQVACGLSILLLPSQVWCEPLPLGPITVIAPRPSVDADESVSKTVIEVDLDPSPSRSAADLLETAAGVTVKSYGGDDGYALASIRGSTPGQVAIYLDGVPLAGAESGIQNLSDISATQIERIEIYRSASPPRFSRAGIGGVINFVTKRSGGEPVTNIETVAGSFGANSTTLSHTGARGPIDYLLMGEVTAATGDYLFESDNGTPYNGSDDFVDSRQNNRYDSRTLLAGIGYRFDGGAELRLRENLYHKTRGIPGLANNQSQSAWYGIDRLLTTLDLRTTRGAIRPTLSLYQQETREQFHDRRGEVGLGAQEIFSLGRTVGVNAGVETIRDNNRRAELYASVSRETFGEEDRMNSNRTTPDRERQVFSVASMAEWGVGRFALFPSIRYERYDDRFGGGDSLFGPDTDAASRMREFVIPRIGAAYAFDSGLKIRGGLGRYFRVPSLAELFGERGVATGNPQLAAETGVTFDLGADYSWGGGDRLGNVATSFFMTESNDLIVWVQNSQRTSIATNIGRARIIGMEMSGQVTTDDLSLSANYTIQQGIDLSDIPHFRNKELPNRPRNDLFVTARYGSKRISGFYELAYTDQFFLDRANFSLISARTVHNAGLQLMLRKGQSNITAEVKNITDNRVSDALGYPMPGRAFYLTATWKFIGATKVP